jgi:hypothetical protein
MLSLADQVKLNLQQLIGLKLSRMALAADMRTLQFGNTKPRQGGVVGEFALHIQCPWRIETDTGVITGSGDLYAPYDESEEMSESFDWAKGDNLQERILRQLLVGYDEKTKQIVNSTDLLSVEAVQVDSVGGFSLELSGGYRLSVFPNSTRYEAWRLFRPSTDEWESREEHFVVPFED